MRDTVPKWLIAPPKKIVIRMPNWIGDAVMATPVLSDVKRQWPNTHLVAMCHQKVAPLFRQDPHIDEILSFRFPSGWIHRFHHIELIETLRAGKYDMGILLTNSFSSAWWFWRGKVDHRIGYSGRWRRWLLSHPIPWPKEEEKTHQVLLYKKILVPLGIPISDTPPELYLSNQEDEEALDFLKRCHIDPKIHTVIGINPGAAYGSAKCWLPERFEEVSRRLIENPNVRLIYFGDQNGAPLVRSICANLSPTQVLDLAGKTDIRQLIALISCCHVLLTNDSGPMHIAAALKTPVLALFGSTNEQKTGPSYGPGKVLNKQVSCSPCYERICPIDFRCMTSIGVDEVLEGIQTLIHKNDKQSSYS